jgi:hypothetical protein
MKLNEVDPWLDENWTCYQIVNCDEVKKDDSLWG